MGLQIYHFFLPRLSHLGKSVNQWVPFVLGVARGHILTGLSPQVAILSFSCAVKSAIHTTFGRFLRLYHFFSDDPRRPQMHILAWLRPNNTAWGVSMMYCKRGKALVARGGPRGQRESSVCGRRGYSLDGRGRWAASPRGFPRSPEGLSRRSNIVLGVFGHAESIGDGPEAARARGMSKVVESKSGRNAD